MAGGGDGIVVAFAAGAGRPVAWHPRELLIRLEAAGSLVLGACDGPARSVAAGLSTVGFVTLSAIVPGAAPEALSSLSALALLGEDPRAWRVEPGPLMGRGRG